PPHRPDEGSLSRSTPPPDRTSHFISKRTSRQHSDGGERSKEPNRPEAFQKKKGGGETKKGKKKKFSGNFVHKLLFILHADCPRQRTAKDAREVEQEGDQGPPRRRQGPRLRGREDGPREGRLRVCRRAAVSQRSDPRQGGQTGNRTPPAEQCRGGRGTGRSWHGREGR
ncbi:hypothetical protein LZ31DRAFT_634014, partial [Colletotrichum somersetense]